MTRVVYVVIAHGEPANLAGLIASLWNPHDSFEIWTDPDSSHNLEPYLSLLLDFGANVRVHSGRPMSWGGYSLVQTTLDAYATLEERGQDYSHAILLSGTHIPLMNADEVFEAVRSLPGWVEASTLSLPNGDLTSSDGVSGWGSHVFLRLQYAYREITSIGMVPVAKRTAWPKDFIHKGSQWHALRRDQVQFLLKERENIHRLYESVYIPDELFAQNTLCEHEAYSEYRKAELVYTDWGCPSPPCRISLSETSEIRGMGRYLFARKAPSNATLEDWSEVADRFGNQDGRECLALLGAKLPRYKIQNSRQNLAMTRMQRLQAEAIVAQVLGRQAAQSCDWQIAAKGDSSAWLAKAPVANFGEIPIHLFLFFNWDKGCTFSLASPVDALPSSEVDFLPIQIPLQQMLGFKLIAPEALRINKWWSMNSWESIEPVALAVRAHISELKALLGGVGVVD